MAEPATDELIARLERMFPYAETDDGLVGIWGDAAALIARIREQDETIKRMDDALERAYETLIEINPSNYDHDDVCRMNDASVEVILGIRAARAARKEPT